MTQNKELDSVKDKIRKLLARTTNAGCTEAEAAQAMEKVGQYLQQYDLSMSEIDIREEKCIQVNLSSGVKKIMGVVNTVVGIGKACGVRVWVSGGGKTRTSPDKMIHFFGMESDVQMAEFLVGIIRSNMEQEKTLFMKAQGESFMERGKKRSMRSSFEHGYAAKINNRLNRMAADRKAAQDARGSDSRALVLVKEAIVEEEFAKKGMRLRQNTNYYQRKNVGSATMAGFAAGDKVNLGRPVGGDTGRNKLLAN